MLEEYEQARVYLEMVSENPVKDDDYIGLELRAVSALYTVYEKLDNPAKVAELNTRIKQLDAALSKQLQKAMKRKR